MNAKEFLQQEINQTHTSGAAKDPNLFISRKYAVGLMEAYHRAKVEEDLPTSKQMLDEGNRRYEDVNYGDARFDGFMDCYHYIWDKLLNR